MKQLKREYLSANWWRERATMMMAVMKRSGTVVAIAAAALIGLFLLRGLLQTPSFEGLTNVESTQNKNDVADPDPDLKCPGQADSVPATCAPADIIKLGYEISLDPRLSTLELKNIQDTYTDRKSGAVLEPFIFDAFMLRAATMYNTDANEGVIQKMLDNMNKNKLPCYTNDFMATAKGFLVGTKEQKTLTVAQSEAVRCYAHRFNGIRKCLDTCK